ncbi:N-acetylmuramoyl-L-alanine amidase [Aneurinibacillus sp. REN35]|uniref:N-acetylmuramoyl-L-alanine amidase n=1 Tax=Aneurinibacillus sp. REN35 TaxID=3237286 RepID=UPI0035291798
MRKTLYGVGILLLLFLGIWSTAVQAAAAPSIQLWINGNNIEPKVPLQLVNGRTLIPVYTFEEGMGMKVQWNGKTRQVVIAEGSKKIELTIGSKTARVNGTVKKLDTAPVIIKDRTFLPFRAVGELLGAEVGWEDKTKSVILNDPVRFQVNGQAVAAKTFQQNNAYFVAAKQIASATGYTFSVKNGKAVFSKGGESKELSAAAYKKIDDDIVVPLSFLEDLAGGEGKWNANNTTYTVSRLTTPPPKPEAPAVGKVREIQQVDGIITVQTSGKVQAKDFVMSNPDRIVVDVSNAKLAGASIPTKGLQEHAAIKNIRYSQFSQDVVRVVIELSGSAKYDLIRSSSSVGVKLTDVQIPLPSVPSTPPVTDPVEIPPPVVTPGDTTPEIPNPVPPAVPLSSKPKVKVVIDAGHGGKDFGASGNGLSEKNLTLAMAQRIADNLRSDEKFEVVVTRDSDVEQRLMQQGVKQELAEKVKIANDSNADLFLSVHINSATASAKGTETFYYSSKSQSYASVIHKKLVQATGFTDRGAKARNLYVTRNTRMPAVLIEIGFISNPTEAKEMAKEAFQQRVADAVYEGIKEYVAKN